MVKEGNKCKRKKSPITKVRVGNSGERFSLRAIMKKYPCWCLDICLSGSRIFRKYYLKPLSSSVWGSLGSQDTLLLILYLVPPQHRWHSHMSATLFPPSSGVMPRVWHLGFQKTHMNGCSFHWLGLWYSLPLSCSLWTTKWPLLFLRIDFCLALGDGKHCTKSAGRLFGIEKPWVECSGQSPWGTSWVWVRIAQLWNIWIPSV